MNSNVIILIISCCTILTILAVMIIMKHDKPKKSGGARAPKKTYLVYAGYYLVLKNGQPLAGTNKLSEATPISTSNYKIPGNDGVFTVLKTEDGSSFITSNTVPVQATILYTDDVKLNYVAPLGVATLNLVKQPDGYLVETLGGSQYVGWGVWGANPSPTYNFGAYVSANTLQLVTM
jgi:hypothetical protein